MKRIQIIRVVLSLFSLGLLFLLLRSYPAHNDYVDIARELIELKTETGLSESKDVALRIEMLEQELKRIESRDEWNPLILLGLTILIIALYNINPSQTK
jgi:hypothetical protein